MSSCDDVVLFRLLRRSREPSPDAAAMICWVESTKTQRRLCMGSLSDIVDAEWVTPPFPPATTAARELQSVPSPAGEHRAGSVCKQVRTVRIWRVRVGAGNSFRRTRMTRRGEKLPTSCRVPIGAGGRAIGSVLKCGDPTNGRDVVPEERRPRSYSLLEERQVESAHREIGGEKRSQGRKRTYPRSAVLRREASRAPTKQSSRTRVAASPKSRGMLSRAKRLFAGTPVKVLLEARRDALQQLDGRRLAGSVIVCMHSQQMCL